MVDLNIEQARHNMIEQQIRTWEVLDQQVLDLIARVPREEFVPRQYRNLAFTDMEIPLGYGQTMMSPKLEARMLQTLAVQPDETVLEIGTGSGYVTALLAQQGHHVFSVEYFSELKQTAEHRLADWGIFNVTVDQGDAATGWARRGTFDVIAVTGSVPALPPELKQQLNLGGRMFVIVGDAPAMDARLITRVGIDEFTCESLFETVVTPLVNARQPQRFML